MLFIEKGIRKTYEFDKIARAKQRITKERKTKEFSHLDETQKKSRKSASSYMNKCKKEVCTVGFRMGSSCRSSRAACGGLQQWSSSPW
jgi:hypothetical protein